MEVFGYGEEKMEFHTVVYKLKDHLYDPQPIEIMFEIPVSGGKKGFTEQNHYYEMIVNDYSSTQSAHLDFLINCNYDFFA